MGTKVNFNKKPKSNNSNKKKFKIAIVILVIILVLYIIIESIIRVYKSSPKNVQESSKLYFNVNDYNSLEELLNRYGCAYIRSVTEDDVLKIYLTFDRDLYTDNQSNKDYFWSMVKVLAEFENYCNFELIDNTRDIDIQVTCEGTNIVEFKINGDVNYYLNHDSEINKTLEKTAITDFSIDSNELILLINQNWSDVNINFGSQESTCNGYNIFFDEGFEYKKVSREVFNIIFTTKYSGSIVSGLNALSTAEEVKEKLGTPTFSNGDLLYGYKGNYNYVFFDFLNEQVSIYPVKTISENDEETLKSFITSMNETLDIKQFANSITSLWTDYDEYDYDSNYVDLKYSLKGIELKISSNSLNNGIFIYQNYSGNKDIQDLDNVYITDTDMIFEEENTRTIDESLNRIEQGDFTEEELKEMGTKFAVRFQGNLADNETGDKGPMFFSRTKEYPDSELERTLVISSYKWFDDYNFIYSVDDDGIYVYNCQTRDNQKLYSVEGSIIINSVSSTQINYNDNQIININ